MRHWWNRTRICPEASCLETNCLDHCYYCSKMKHNCNDHVVFCSKKYHYKYYHRFFCGKECMQKQVEYDTELNADAQLANAQLPYLTQLLEIGC